MSFTQRWLTTLLEGMDTHLSPDQVVRVLDSCGRACARSAAAQAEKLVARASDLQAAVDILNLAGKGGGHLELEHADGTVSISGQYDRCYCPLWKGVTSDEGPASFCHCSEGYLRALFEPVFRRPVQVTFEQTVRRGDPVCRFRIR